MKRRIILILVTTAPLGLALTELPSCGGNPPIAVAEPPSRRIVSKGGNSRIETSFKIWNRGGKDLLLFDAATSCGCTVASIEPKVVPPGKSARVSVVGSPPSAGEKSVSISIGSNQGSARPVSVSLTMVTQAELPFVADHSGPVRFGMIRRNEVASPQIIRIDTYEHEGSDPWLRSAGSGLKGLSVRQVSLTSTPVSGVIYRKYKFEVKLLQNPFPGDFTDEVQVHGGEPMGFPALSLPVHGTVIPPVRVTPSALIASIDADGVDRRLTLLLQADDPDFALDAQCDPRTSNLFDVERTSVLANRNVFKLRLKLPIRDKIRFNLVFVTNHPDAPQVTVPVSLAALQKR